MLGVKKRVTEKHVEIKGRNFIIKKVDVLTSCYIASILTSKLLPAGIAGYVGIETPLANQTMSKQEFREIQLDILTCVSEKLAADTISIFDESGNPRAVDLDAGLILRLTIESLQFNFTDFFDESLWKDLIPAPLLLILKSPLTSTSLFSFLSRMGIGNKENSGTEHTP